MKLAIAATTDDQARLAYLAQQVRASIAQLEIDLLQLAMAMAALQADDYAWRSCPCGRGDRHLCSIHKDDEPLTSDEALETLRRKLSGT